jgi:hypothetical protein
VFQIGFPASTIFPYFSSLLIYFSSTENEFLGFFKTKFLLTGGPACQWLYRRPALLLPGPGGVPLSPSCRHKNYPGLKPLVRRTRHLTTLVQSRVSRRVACHSDRLTPASSVAQVIEAEQLMPPELPSPEHHHRLPSPGKRRVVAAAFSSTWAAAHRSFLRCAGCRSQPSTTAFPLDRAEASPINPNVGSHFEPCR